MSALPSWLEDEPEQSRDDGSHFGEEARPLHATAERQASDLEQASTDGRRPRIGVLPLLVFCLVALGAVGSFVLFHQKVSADERRLLEVRARETTALFESFSEGIQRTLVGSAVVADATRGDRVAVATSFSESLKASLFATAALIEFGEAAAEPEATFVGAEPAVFPLLADEAIERLRQVSAEGGLRLIDVRTVGGTRVAGLAAATKGGSPRVAYAELLVPDLFGAAGQGDDEIQFAFYLTGEESEAAVVATNASDLPIPGPRVVERLSLGSEEALVVVGARTGLAGSLSALSPWIALSAGLIGAVILTALVEITRRGRDDALGLVSDLRQANTDLDQSEQRFRGLFDNANDVVFTTGADGTILSVNRAGELFTGYSGNELVGRSFAELLVPEALGDAHRTFVEMISRHAGGRPRSSCSPETAIGPRSS